MGCFPSKKGSLEIASSKGSSASSSKSTHKPKEEQNSNVQGSFASSSESAQKPKEGHNSKVQASSAPSSKSTQRPEEEQNSSAQIENQESDDVEVVCALQDLKDGEMKECEVSEGNKVLVVREGDSVSAFSPKCTHYGAPLIKGAYSNGKIRCPWHGACFSATTGDIEDFPGLDGLCRFNVQIEDNQVKIHAKKSDLANTKCQAKMVKRDENNNSTYVIIGGGAAGAEAAETLRKEAYRGRLVMISRESVPPYDRPKLSKAPHLTSDQIQLRSHEFYKEHDIELMLGTEVINVDTQTKTVTLHGSDSIAYDKLLIATGGRPRKLTLSGADAPNVKVLRNVQDANEIASLGTGKKVAVIGSSFIGMEVAAFLASKESTVTVVGRGDFPFGPVLGEKVGERVMRWFQTEGVTFKMNDSAEELVVEDGNVTQIKLVSGGTVDVDLVVVGIGVVPATEFLTDSGIELDQRGNIVVDEFMESSVAGVYAAGDIANFPLSIGGVVERAVIGHWQLAMKHGQMAGRNMVDVKAPLDTVPFFWSVLFGKSLRYAGSAPGFDSVVIEGDLEDMAFCAYYCKEDSVLAVSTLNKDPVAAKFAQYLQSGKLLSKEDLEKDVDGWLN